MADKKCCSSCKWYEPFNGVCFNGDSENCADYVDADDVCPLWETETNMSIEEAIDLLEDGEWKNHLGDMDGKCRGRLMQAIEIATSLMSTHPDTQPNEPLTLEELRRMGGKPVWCEELQCWGIVKYETVGAWKNKPFLAGVWQNPDFETAVSFEYDIKSRGLTLYRRPPKGENE